MHQSPDVTPIFCFHNKNPIDILKIKFCSQHNTTFIISRFLKLRTVPHVTLYKEISKECAVSVYIICAFVSIFVCVWMYVCGHVDVYVCVCMLYITHTHSPAYPHT